MLKSVLKTVTLLFAILAQAWSYSSFINKIPNGSKVPNPCGSGTWAAVGHMVASGSGGLTKFGADFEDNGNRWTKAFCQMDSDGDGKSNGLELGDPYCIWSEGKTPSPTWFLSNPAVADGSCYPTRAPRRPGSSSGENSSENSSEEEGIISGSYGSANLLSLHLQTLCLLGVSCLVLM